MPTRRTLAAGVVAILLLLAGCAGSAPLGADESTAIDQDGGDAMEADEHDAEETTGDDDADVDESFSSTSDTSGTVNQVPADRRLIFRGSVDLEVESYEAASDEVRAIVDSNGGFISDSSRQVHERNNATWTTGTLVVRVPSDDFDETIDAISEVGEVTEVRTESEDVTDQLVDIEARLKNLRAERDRYRELYEEANETEDVLAVQERLSSTQSEIERLEARQRALEERVAYATITVSIAEPEPEGVLPDPAAWYDTPVTAAFLESVSGVKTVLRAAVVATAYAAPYLLAFGAPFVVLLGGVLFYRSRS